MLKAFCIAAENAAVTESSDDEEIVPMWIVMKNSIVAVTLRMTNPWRLMYERIDAGVHIHTQYTSIASLFN